MASTTYQGGTTQITAPTGTERIFVDDGGSVNAWMFSNQIIKLGTASAMGYGTSALAAAGTLTAANITGATDTVFLGMTGAFAAAANIQLPTVATVVAALSAQQGVGSTYVVRVINPSSYTLTITTNTGWTLGSGTYALLTETFRDFLVTITSATTATFQDVGGGGTTAE